MNHDTAADPDDRPLMPPEPDSGVGALRWVITGIALVLLIIGAWRAYVWFSADVERRRAVAEGAAPTLQAPAEPNALPSESPPVSPAVPSPAPPPPSRSAEPPAPAVTGIAGVNKCVVDGQVTYTNEPCPVGANEPPPAPTGVDANGVSGSAGDGAPVVVPRPSAFANSGQDPAQDEAVCHYLVAEIDRLDFEFKQPLPPPILDHISTRLAELRGQHSAAQCEPLRKADQPAKTKAARSGKPVTTERRRARDAQDEDAD